MYSAHELQLVIVVKEVWCEIDIGFKRSCTNIKKIKEILVRKKSSKGLSLYLTFIEAIGNPKSNNI